MPIQPTKRKYIMKAISLHSFELLNNLASTATGALKSSLDTIVSDIIASTDRANIRTLFKFDELSDIAKEKAIEQFRYINVNYDGWSDDIIDDNSTLLESYGFIKSNIRYSGFCSQGDGASFTCDYIDIEKYLRATKQWSKYKVLHTLIKDQELQVKTEIINHRYCHSNSVIIELDNYLTATLKQDDAINELLEDMNQFIRDKATVIYNELYDSYYNLISDDCVKEAIVCNDFEFDINGEQIF